MNTEDLDFIKNSIKEDIVLPEKLSAENIEKLLSSEVSPKRKKRNIRKFIAVSVAACVAIVSIALFPYDKIIPEETYTEKSGNNATENSSNPETTTISSYAELIKNIREYAAETYKEKYYLYGSSSDGYSEESAVEDNVTATGTNTGSAIKGQYGETNIREDGVYEEDIFVTDGEYLYYVDAHGKISIVKAIPDGSLEISAIIENEPYEEDAKETLYYTGLYIKGNYLIASFTRYSYGDGYSRYSCISGVEIYDVSNKKAPVKLKSFALDGAYISSRIIDNELLLITNYDITLYFSYTQDELLIPSSYNDGMKATVPCDCIYIDSKNTEAYVNIAKIDLSDTDKEPVVTSFLGRVTDTYCTATTLYIMGYEYSSYYYDDMILVSDSAIAGGSMISPWGRKTKITSIDISGDSAQKKNSIELEGSILNSYSIDEHSGYLRVAMTKNDDNTLVVLDDKLEIAGELTGIAPGERIRSVRFMGDTAYVVTFVQTDPLFVIDLSDPVKPVITGEVKLPGFSAYLHPVGEGYLVGIGYGGTENGLDGSAKISLFDVKDPENPREVDCITINNCDFSVDSKAYVSVSENSFMIPFSIWKSMYDEDYYFKGIYTGALYVSAENGKLVRNNAYIVRSLEGSSRCTFIDDRVYVYGVCSGVASFNMESAELISSIGAIKGEYGFSAVEKTTEEILN